MAKKSNKKNWIKGAIKNPGAFTAKAKAAKMSVAQFRDKVLANPENYPVATVQQARLAKTLSKFQPGGNPYAMPTSAATSGYTSNMSGMAGAHQAQMQLQQLQQQSMDFQAQQAARAEQMQEQNKEQLQQGMQQDLQTLASNQAEEAIASGKEARIAKRLAKAQNKQAIAQARAAGFNATGKFAGQIARGTATGAQVAQSSKNTADLLGNLSSFGQGAQAGQAAATAGQTASTVAEGATTAASTGAGIGMPTIGTLASLVGTGVEMGATDKDDTTTNTGEAVGRGLKGIGSGIGIGGTIAGAAGLALGPIGWAALGLAGGTAALLKQRKQKMEARELKAKEEAQAERIGQAEQQAFLQSQLETGRDMGYNVGSSGTNSYLPGYQMMKTGGGPEMIKRADGSYSQRGLWDNIRDNEGSGREPTEEMLKQEKKIKAKKMQGGGGQEQEVQRMLKDNNIQGNVQLLNPAEVQGTWQEVNARRAANKKQFIADAKDYGLLTGALGLASAGTPLMGIGLAPEVPLMAETLSGMAANYGAIKLNSQTRAMKQSTDKKKEAGGSYMKPLPGGAVEFVGPKHSKGGIKLDKNTEVEGGETMDKVNMKSNGGAAGDYIFSDFLKLGKKTFAQRHKEMLARGASQADIQKLAKMQEEVARREGRDENGPRNPDNIMQPGGEVNYGEANSIIPSRAEFLANPGMYEFNPEGAFAEGWTEDQHETAYGTFQTDDGKAIGDNEVEEAKMMNPWYDWEGFDPANPDDVTAYQEALNSVAGREIVKVDGKFGQQTASAYIPFKSQKVNEVAAVPAPEEAPAEEAPVEETPESIPAIKLRNTPMLPYQLIGPIAELTSKYPQPNTIAASPTGRIKLPRVNFNSERAALSNQVSSANRYIEGQAAGPAAISSKLSMLDKQRKGNIEIANTESRTNKDLMAREELANLQASQFDAGQTFAARQFNAIAQNQRDQNEYEKRMLAYNQLGTNLAQYSNDLRAYKAEERVAEASQIDNEYTRQKYLEQLRRDSKKRKSPYYGMNDAQLREAAARMVESAPTYQLQNERRMNALLTAQQAAQGNQTNQTTTEPTTALTGGYIKKYGKVKRKK